MGMIGKGVKAIEVLALGKKGTIIMPDGEIFSIKDLSDEELFIVREALEFYTHIRFQEAMDRDVRDASIFQRLAKVQKKFFELEAERQLRCYCLWN